MSKHPKIAMAWSGGKDSALALYLLLEQGLDIAVLMTTLNRQSGRINHHNVQDELLKQQAAAIGIPLRPLYLSSFPTNEEYSRSMADLMEEFRSEDIHAVAFGDIFLEDLRLWRENNLKQAGMQALFPLWQQPTVFLAREFLESGFKARVVSVDCEQLAAEFVGREYDAAFLDDLPSGVDPCGENGEFHTFVYDGPLYTHPIAIHNGRQYMDLNRFACVELNPVSG